MKIAVTTFFTESYEPLAAITVTTLQRYCDRHKYDLHIHKIPDGNVDFVITKDALLLLDEYDIVMGIECDILITNFKIKIEDYNIDSSDFLICRDVNNVNMGCLIVKKTDGEGKRILEFILNQKGNFKTEQNVLEHYGLTENCFLPHPSINSIPYEYYHNYGYINYNGQSKPTVAQGDWVKGNFNCHLPAKPMQERIEIFNQIKEHIIL